MKGLILAAGYGTRLYPLTERQAKPLLEVSGKPMIEYIVEKISGIDCLDEIYIVHNEKFDDNFKRWADRYKSRKKIRLFNDGSTDDSNKLGAVGDMKFVIERTGIEDDLLVVAGDNLFDFPLEGFVDFFMKKGAAVALYRVGDMELIRKYSVVEMDDEKRIRSFEEKPENPATNLAAICLYLFPAGKLKRIFDYIGQGLNPDAPGYYIKWLVENDSVFGMVLEGDWLDIGDFKSLEEAGRKFRA